MNLFALCKHCRFLSNKFGFWFLVSCLLFARERQLEKKALMQNYPNADLQGMIFYYDRLRNVRILKNWGGLNCHFSSLSLREPPYPLYKECDHECRKGTEYAKPPNMGPSSVRWGWASVGWFLAF